MAKKLSKEERQKTQPRMIREDQNDQVKPHDRKTEENKSKNKRKRQAKSNLLGEKNGFQYL